MMHEPIKIIKFWYDPLGKFEYCFCDKCIAKVADYMRKYEELLKSKEEKPT